jgi:hypothetical protein
MTNVYLILHYYLVDAAPRCVGDRCGNEWVFSTVEPARRRTNPLLRELGEFWDTEKSFGKPVKLVRMRVAIKAVKLLFKMLIASKKVLD